MLEANGLSRRLRVYRTPADAIEFIICANEERRTRRFARLCRETASQMGIVPVSGAYHD